MNPTSPFSSSRRARRRQAFALELEVLLEFRQGCKAHRHVDTAESMGSVRGPRSALPRASRDLRPPGLDSEPTNCAHSEQQNGDEDTRNRALPRGASPPHRSRTLAKPSSVDGWVEHRHRGWTYRSPRESPRGSLRSHHQACSTKTDRIDPYEPALMQPSSLESASTALPVFRNSRYPFIDVKAQQRISPSSSRSRDEAFSSIPVSSSWARPSSGSRSGRPRGKVEGKSSLGRLGLLIHSTAGFIDPAGTATWRSSCRTSRTPDHDLRGEKIGQISFVQLSELQSDRTISGDRVEVPGATRSHSSRYWQTSKTSLTLAGGAHPVASPRQGEREKAESASSSSSKRPQGRPRLRDMALEASRASPVPTPSARRRRRGDPSRTSAPTRPARSRPSGTCDA